mgnify:CR=1 FL=1
MATKYLSSNEDGFEATDAFASEDDDISEIDEDGILKPKNSEEIEFGDGELGEEITDDEDPEIMA